MNVSDNMRRLALMGMAAGIGWTASAQNLPKDWHLKDRQKDGIYGISLDKAYEQVKGKKGKTVVVAVIDSGIDTTHEDLKTVLWTNAGEIPGNGKDDDKNGYVDDVHGWNFIGGKDGRNVDEDSYESARVFHRYKDRFSRVTDPASLPAADRELYTMWKKSEAAVAGDPQEMMTLMLIKNAYRSAASADSLLRTALGKQEYKGSEVEAGLADASKELKKAKRRYLTLYQGLGIDLERSNKEVLSEIGEYVSSQERKAEAAERAPKNYRGEIVGDNEADINDRFYGNNDIMASTPFHGTHVSGIIAASRNNNKGVKGVADNVRIMTIRAVPDGDEHDKDVALAIRYAVDNGAKIINMSFGKAFSPEKTWVDEAVKYAEGKGVLLVHAAGNDASDNDTTDNFPNPKFKGGIRAKNWITVGASGDPKNGGLVADFSNFGKDEVDVFAPGVNIHSTVPGGTSYGNASGTSMAAPVVSGLAAFVLSYYPNLTVSQLKEVIERSAQAPSIQVTNPKSGAEVALKELSRTGGLVNAYEAVRLAESMTGGTPKPPVPAKGKAKVKAKARG